MAYYKMTGNGATVAKNKDGKETYYSWSRGEVVKEKNDGDLKHVAGKEDAKSPDYKKQKKS